MPTHAESLAAPRNMAWAAGLLAVTVLSAAALAVWPWGALGVAAGGGLLVALLARPYVVLAGMLAIGAVDLSFMTGGFKTLLPALGGLDMNGIRLVGFVGGFTGLVLIHREMLTHALERYGRWFLAFLLFGAATLVYTPSLIEGLRLLFKLAVPFVLFVAVLTFARDPGRLDRLGDWTLLAAAVLALVVNPVFALMGGYQVGLDGVLRLTGMGVHQSPFAAYLVAMLLLAFARYSVRGQARYLVLCTLLAVWIVLTVTRIALPAVAVGLGGAALLAALTTRNTRVLLATGLVGAVLAAFMAPLVLDRSLGYVPTPPELLALLRDPAGLTQAIRWQSRDVAWPLVFQQFQASPVLGHGLGASTEFMLRVLPVLGPIVHNDYLRLAMDTGLVGTGLFLAALLAWLVAAVRAARFGSDQAREFALAATGAILAWAVIAITDNSFDYYAQFTQYVGFFAGGAVAAWVLRDGAGREAAVGRAGQGAGAGEPSRP